VFSLLSIRGYISLARDEAGDRAGERAAGKGPAAR
jgi:hypothetical protein